ncbi:MAG: DUF5069 domain-containing protein [Akkermansiaceae bacterium]|nr:DUF5069 domain-containing protein [Akkermansiaceae bacterium]
MNYPRSPYDRSVADTMHWARLIDKIRQHHAGELPEEFVAALGHPQGVDGHFLGHFGLTIEQAIQAVTGKTDAELAGWLEMSVDGFETKRCAWNELAPNLGRQGYPMDRMLKIAMKRLYKGFDWSPEMSVFELIDRDEGRSS